MDHDDWVEELKAQLESHPEAKVRIKYYDKIVEISEVMFQGYNDAIVISLEDL